MTIKRIFQYISLASFTSAIIAVATGVLVLGLLTKGEMMMPLWWTIWFYISGAVSALSSFAYLIFGKAED